MDDALNKVDLDGHKGRHSVAYHRYVWDRLAKAVGNSSGIDYRLQLRGELERLRVELLTPGTTIRGLLKLP
ncbi:MAG: AHH domain-containing protein [Steroidobacteraceae bacterium]|nr:AHH domain-containing protein [Steroidobacteraceae bacterium]